MPGLVSHNAAYGSLLLCLPPASQIKVYVDVKIKRTSIFTCVKSLPKVILVASSRLVIGVLPSFATNTSSVASSSFGL